MKVAFTVDTQHEHCAERAVDLYKSADSVISGGVENFSVPESFGNIVNEFKDCVPAEYQDLYFQMDRHAAKFYVAHSKKLWTLAEEELRTLKSWIVTFIVLLLREQYTDIEVLVFDDEQKNVPLEREDLI